MGILYPFFVDPTFMNLAKMQIPFSRVTRIYIPILLKFVSQQSGFAFFGAYDFGCAHFFNLRMEDTKWD